MLKTVLIVENSVENVKNCAKLQCVIQFSGFPPPQMGKTWLFPYFFGKNRGKSFQQAVENCVENFTDCKTGGQ